MKISGFAKKSLVAGLAVLSVAGALTMGAGDASAGWYGPYGRYHRGYGGGAVAAGVIGGMALGALAASAARPAYAYPAPAYGPGPVYYDEGPACYATTRRVWVEGWGWQWRRMTVCN